MKKTRDELTNEIMNELKQYDDMRYEFWNRDEEDEDGTDEYGNELHDVCPCATWYVGDGVSHECYVMSLQLHGDDINMEIHDFVCCDDEDCEICDIDYDGVADIAMSLGIDTEVDTNRKPTMRESYDIICEHYEHLKHSIAEYVKQHADENGIMMLEDKDDASRPWVITTQEYDRLPDEHTECRCIALRVVGDDVQFCALASTLFDEDTQYQSSVLSQEKNDRFWYTLDWDMANPFQYNIERIAYYLTIND